MVSLDDAVIARLESHGSRFEILVDPDLALEFKNGKEIEISDILAADGIFKDSKKGDRISEAYVYDVLGVQSVADAAKIILKKGELQLTTQQRRKILLDRKKQVISIISKNAINPQTGLPHPPSRIERAMEEAGVHIDLLKSAEEQVPKVVKSLRPLLPLKFEEKEVAVKVPPQFAGKAMSSVRLLGDIKREEWQSDGSWIGVIKLPAGMVDELFEKLNEITHGEIETKILK